MQEQHLSSFVAFLFVVLSCATPLLIYAQVAPFVCVCLSVRPSLRHKLVLCTDKCLHYCKAHVRASLILWTFVSRDIDILTKAFTTYVCPILEYCTPVWSPHTACNINKIESCQRWFTKRIKGLCGLDYSQRLEHIGLETLQLRRIKYDLLIYYKNYQWRSLLALQSFGFVGLYSKKRT